MYENTKKKKYNCHSRATIISRKQVASINYIGLVKLITRLYTEKLPRLL